VQLPSNMGKKVTEAVICRKMDWISACISASVFSSGASLPLCQKSALILVIVQYHTLARHSRSLPSSSMSWTLHSSRISEPMHVSDSILMATPLTYIKLPPLHVFAGLFAGDDNDELGYLAPVHPLFKLRHDLLDVRFNLVVGRDWKRQYSTKVTWAAYTPIIVRPYFLTL
jgi:hypothetical protein